jgi:hypothetical protein
VSIIRVSATVVRVPFLLIMVVTAGLNALGDQYTEVTGLTLSNTNILKITGQASGASGGTGDIVPN